MKKGFTDLEKSECSKIQWLLTYASELNLLSSDIELLKQRRNELVASLKNKYYHISEEQIEEIINECTPDREDYGNSLERYLYGQSEDFYNAITIDSDDQNQPVCKNEKEIDDSLVHSELINYEFQYGKYRIFIS